MSTSARFSKTFYTGFAPTTDMSATLFFTQLFSDYRYEYDAVFYTGLVRLRCCFLHWLCSDYGYEYDAVFYTGFAPTTDMSTMLFFTRALLRLQI